jgi:hypothetical protein
VRNGRVGFPIVGMPETPRRAENAILSKPVQNRATQAKIRLDVAVNDPSRSAAGARSATSAEATIASVSHTVGPTTNDHLAARLQCALIADREKRCVPHQAISIYSDLEAELSRRGSI